MDKQNRELLAKLYTSQLKQLAEEKGIDCGDSPDRIDYLSILGKSKKIKREDLERFIGEMETEEEKGGREEVYLGEIENILKDFKSKGAIFEKADHLLSRMKSNFNEGNLEGTISHGVSSPDLIKEIAKNYETVRRAFIIYAFRQLVSDVKNSGIDTDEAETLVSKAAELFHEGDKEELDGLLEEIADKASYIQKEQAKHMKDLIFSVEEFIDQARDLGANVDEARKFLLRAEEAFDSKTFNKVNLFVSQARKAAEEARSDRIQGISDSLLFARTILNDARDIGADVEEAKRLYTQAQSAFEGENYRECKALIKEVEQLALELQDAQIKKALKLRSRREPEERAPGEAGKEVVEVEPEVVSQPQRRGMRPYPESAAPAYPKTPYSSSPGPSYPKPTQQRMKKTKCPNCGQRFPVKAGKGPVRIECPFCGMRGMMP